MYQPLAKLDRLNVGMRARLASLARDHTEAALNTILAIMNQKESPPLARLRAAQMILNRGWGLPTPMVAAEGEGQPQRLLKIVREYVHVTKTPEEIAAEGEEPLLIEWRAVRDGNGSARR